MTLRPPADVPSTVMGTPGEALRVDEGTRALSAILTRALELGGAPMRGARALLRRGSGVDWEAEGLLDGAGDEEATAGRAALLEELALTGVPLDELRAAVEGDRLAVLPVERVLAGDERYSLTELADEVGLDREKLAAQLTALGQPIPEPDQRCFDDGDLRTAATLAGLIEAGVDPEALRQSGRVLAHNASITASVVRELVGESLLRPGDSERDLGLRYASVAEALGPQLQDLVGHLLQVHLREQVRRHVVRRAERRAGRPDGSVAVTVAFLDLVDFTALGEQAPPERLGQIATRLADLAADAVEPPVRLVKLIGDGAMLAAPEPEPLVHAVHDLVAAVEREGLPKLRVGIASGEAVARRGDLYGSAVNRASRICAKAEPGQVLAEESVRAAECDGVTWRAVGRRRVKGVAKPMALHALQRG